MLQHLNLATYHNSLARSTKSMRSLALPPIVSIRFQVLFHSPPGVLFTFPSRYYFAIGHWLVFRLGGWAPRLHAGFHVSGTTLVSLKRSHISSTGVLPSLLQLSSCLRLYLSVYTSDPQPHLLIDGLASFPFARRYLENRCFFLFLRVLRCFSSPGFLLYDYIFIIGYLPIKTGEFPHSDICGSRDICSSPQLIAACHVLLRLPVPRHSPYALCCLTYSYIIFRQPSFST